MLIKYPKTKHLSDFSDGLEGKYIVVEEKMDGTQVGISFDGTRLILQSRNKILNGNIYDKQFDLLKQWANVHANSLFDLLGNRYVMFGEWIFYKHNIFYDMLPHYFMEFDIYDKENDCFLSTFERSRMTTDTSIISVATLWSGIVEADDVPEITGLIGNSLFKSNNWKNSFVTEAKIAHADIDEAFKHTDDSNLMEGLYIKVESDNKVIHRLKHVRPDFIKSISADIHWKNTIPITNVLRGDSNIWR